MRRNARNGGDAGIGRQRKWHFVELTLELLDQKSLLCYLMHVDLFEEFLVLGQDSVSH